MSSVSSSHMSAGNPSFVDKYLKIWIPLLTPAVTADGFRVNQNLLKMRLKITVIPFIALIAFQGSPVNTLMKKIVKFPTNEILGIAVGVIAFIALIIVPPVLISMLDKNKAQKIVDENAVNAYLCANNPPTAALRHISNHLSAAQLLVERRGDLNKQDELGRCFLSEPEMDITVFKFLVDRECTPLSAVESGFLHAVMSNNPEYLRYLVRNNRIAVNDLYTIRSIATSFWCVVQHREVADLLLEMGLNINARGNDGRTALERLLLQEEEGLPEEEVSGVSLRPRVERIALLREMGASL